MIDVPTLIKYGGPALAVLGTFYGGATFTHDKLQEIEQIQYTVADLDTRLEQKILNDRFTILEQRIQDIEIRYGADLFEAPGPVREQYRIMRKERDQVEREINAVQQDYKRRGNQSNRYYDQTRGVVKVE